MKLIPIGADAAEEIFDLASQFHHENLHLTVDDIAESLEIADSEEGNLSFGLEQNGKLEGYLLGWLSDSLIGGRVEQVALIDDVVVVPSARGHLKRLISAFVDELKIKDKGHLAVEAVVVAEARQVFTQHSRFLENLGYEVVCEIPYEDEELNSELTFVRYHPWGSEGESVEDEDLLDSNLPLGGDQGECYPVSDDEDTLDFVEEEDYPNDESIPVDDELDDEAFSEE